MKCYYEELGVEREASDADIKSAYRKLALRWHPDKNPDCLEDAKQRFLLIQQAYEVLIDPQERAFYDNHREQILRGKNSNFEDNCLNVYEYFTVTCFKGYGDIAGGFYAVYNEVFSKIAAEDAEFMEDEEEIENIPSFGDSQSSYENVVGPFYAYWSAYCTKKTYTWLCPYDIQEAKDRRIIRAIDKEMKKVVQKAKKDRNEEVRNLVSFVRKRDKRVQEYNRKLEERTILNRKKQEQKRLEQLQKRQIELQEMQKNVKKTAIDESYEAQLKELEQQYDDSSEYEEECDEIITEDLEGELSDLADELEDKLPIDYDELFCVACNKKYKNKRAYVDHEMNKKHLDNVEQMRKEMIAEEAANTAYENENWDNLSEVEDEEEDDEIVTEASMITKNKFRKPKYQPINELLENFGNLDVHQPASDVLSNVAKINDDEIWNDKKTNKKRKSKKSNEITTNKPKQTNNNNNNNNNVEVVASETATTSSKQNEDLPQCTDTSQQQNACATCGTRFESKNKLFNHLKATKHSIYLGKSQSTAANNVNTNSMSNTKKNKNKKK